MRLRKTIATAALCSTAVLVGACGSSASTRAVAPPVATTTTPATPSVTTVPVTTVPVTTPTTVAAHSIGSSISFVSDDLTGTVTLTAVTDPAKLDAFSVSIGMKPSAGMRYVSVSETIHADIATSGNTSACYSTLVVGSDNQYYQFDPDTGSLPNAGFPNGCGFDLAGPGTISGKVLFDLPIGVSIAEVAFSPDGANDVPTAPTGIWKI